MTILTPAEAIRLMSYCLKESGIMGSFPISEEEKLKYKIHHEQEDKLREADSKYIKKPWYAEGKEPVRRTQEEINERSSVFIKNMISERPSDFDLMKEVDSYDPIENFKKSCEEIVKKSNA